MAGLGSLGFADGQDTKEYILGIYHISFFVGFMA